MATENERIASDLARFTIPLDASGFAAAFDSSDVTALTAFFHEYGFVVVRDMFSKDECATTRDAMWSVVETSNKGFDRDDVHTWSALKTSGSYGLSSKGPCFHPALVRNRTNRALIAVLESLIGEEVLLSQDRFTIYRGTKTSPEAAAYATGPKNLHLDLNPWWWTESHEGVVSGVQGLRYEDPQDFIRENNLVVKSLGESVQCVLNLCDNRTEDGGTVLVPGFHTVFDRWTACNSLMRREIPWFNYSDHTTDPSCALFLDLAVRIPMREGSVLIWSQRMLHGSAPNESKATRMAQFLRAFPSASVNEARRARRAAALDALLRSSGARTEVHSPEALRVFGLD